MFNGKRLKVAEIVDNLSLVVPGDGTCSKGGEKRNEDK